MLKLPLFWLKGHRTILLTALVVNVGERSKLVVQRRYPVEWFSGPADASKNAALRAAYDALVVRVICADKNVRLSSYHHPSECRSWLCRKLATSISTMSSLRTYLAHWGTSIRLVGATALCVTCMIRGVFTGGVVRPLINPTVGGVHSSDLGQYAIADYYVRNLPSILQ